MRKIRLFSIAALALAMAACSSEENTLETQSPAANGTMHFTATIAAPSGDATTRTVYTEEGTLTLPAVLQMMMSLLWLIPPMPCIPLHPNLRSPLLLTLPPLTK